MTNSKAICNIRHRKDLKQMTDLTKAGTSEWSVIHHQKMLEGWI